MSQREPRSREGGPLAWVAGIGALVVLGALQISPLADWGPVRADGLLAMAVAWAALAGPRRGLVFGMIAGGVEDMLIGRGVVFTLLRGLLGLLAGTVRPVLNVRQALISIPLVAVATILQEAALALVHRNWAHFGAIWLPAAAANATIAWPIYRLAYAVWRPGGGPAPARRG